MQDMEPVKKEIDKAIKEVRENSGHTWSHDADASLKQTEVILLLAKVIAIKSF